MKDRVKWASMSLMPLLQAAVCVLIACEGHTELTRGMAIGVLTMASPILLLAFVGFVGLAINPKLGDK